MSDQKRLFDKGEPWEESWNDMPEFIQKDLEPFKTIYVHFESRADMDAFSKLVGQTVGLDTRSIWWPEAEIGRYSDKAYVDEGEPLVVMEGQESEEIADFEEPEEWIPAILSI